MINVAKKVIILEFCISNFGPTEIITNQNVEGLWRNSKDVNGKVIMRKNKDGKSVPVQDNTKEEKLIDKMVQDNIGAMLIQETWKPGNHNNVEIGDTGVTCSVTTEKSG